MAKASPGLFVRLALAVLGGGLFASATPPLTFWPGPFLGLACLCEAIRRTPAREGPLRAAMVGTTFGFVTHAMAMPAMPDVLSRYGGLQAGRALALALALWMLQALPYALAALASAWFRAREEASDPSGWLVLPLAITASTALTPQLFPWQPGALLVDVPWLLQVADLGGASAVTLCLAVSTSALWELARTHRPRGALVIALGCSLLLPCVYAVHAFDVLHRERVGKTLAIGVVQGNASVADMASQTGRMASLAVLRDLTAQVERKNVLLTLWGEGAFPFELSRARTLQPIDARRVVGGDVAGPVLVGLVSYDARHSYNSAWRIERGGEISERVDKQQLLPFAEFVPDGPLLDLLGVRPRGRLRPGVGGKVPAGGYQLGVLICYEDLFSRLARARVQSGAEVLVNLTNDVWFGTSSEPVLHERMARLRAVETRRELVRATDTGVSSHIAATGEVLASLPAHVPGAFVAHVLPRRERTLFVRFGDWVPYACLLLLLMRALGRSH